MAASTEPLIGGFYKLEISTNAGVDWDKVALVTDLSVDESIDEREIVHRDNCGAKDYIPSYYSGSCSGSAYIKHAATAGSLMTQDLKALFYAKTVFDFKITPIDCADPMVGDFEITGSTGFFTSFNSSFPTEEEGTADFSIRFRSAPDYTAVV